MHESPRTPCRYQLCVRIYACTTSTAFTLAPCWHQIRMHHINSLHFCAFASAFNNCKPNSSAKISKKRSNTFHLAVKGIQHTSRWLKLERQQQVQKLLRTPPAQAVDDPIQTAAGMLNKFCWIEGISKPRAMAGQLEITEATSWWLSTTSATDSGRQGDPASCRPTRTTAEGCLPSHSKGSFFFFSLFHDADRRATKRLLHRVQHDAVEWRKRTSTSVSFVVQLGRGEGPRRPGTGAPPKRSWRGPEEKWRPGETRARYVYMESWSIRRRRRSCPAWWKELGTRQAGNSAQLDHHWTCCWTENDLDVDLGTCGCVDHRQNFGPQSVESINTSAAHILARVNLKLGRVLTTSQEPQPGNWRRHIIAGWNQSVGAMEYGAQVATMCCI